MLLVVCWLLLIGRCVVCGVLCFMLLVRGCVSGVLFVVDCWLMFVVLVFEVWLFVVCRLLFVGLRALMCVVGWLLFVGCCVRVCYVAIIV